VICTVVFIFIDLFKICRFRFFRNFIKIYIWDLKKLTVENLNIWVGFVNAPPVLGYLFGGFIFIGVEDIWGNGFC